MAHKQKGDNMSELRYSVKCASFTESTAVFEAIGLLEENGITTEIFDGNIMISIASTRSTYYCDAEFEVLVNITPKQGEKEDDVSNLMMKYILASIYTAIKRLYYVCAGAKFAKIGYRIVGLNAFDEIITNSTTLELTPITSNEKIPVT